MEPNELQPDLIQTDETLLIKAHLIDAPSSRQSARSTSAAIAEDPFKGSYSEHNLLEPPFPLEFLTHLPDYNYVLESCITAYETNIEGFGFQLECLIKDEEQRKKLESEIALEAARINNWFAMASVDPKLSFTELCRRRRVDLESTGNAYWEVLRDGTGAPAGLVHLESYTMRLGRIDPEPQPIKLQVRVEGDDFLPAVEEIEVETHFRKFCQVRGNKKVWFKEYGDPRRMSRKTGKFLSENEELPSDDAEATEIIHFKIYCPYSAYGVPRYMSALLAVLGSRSAEETNVNHWDNNAIPHLVMSISGGKLNDESVRRVEAFLGKIKGTDGPKILILEMKETAQGRPQGRGAQIRIDDLSKAIAKDAGFLEYLKSNAEQIRCSFRLPPIFIGKSEDYNRATAQVSLLLAEQQIFGPERELSDQLIDRLLLIPLGVKYHRFKGNSAPQNDSVALAEILAQINQTDSLFVDEKREILSRVFNRTYLPTNQQIVSLKDMEARKPFAEQADVEKAGDEKAIDLSEEDFQALSEEDLQALSELTTNS